MNLNTPTTVEEVVIGTLATTSASGDVLLTATRQLKQGFTKQALYTVLRKLLREEVLVKHGMQFSLARPWLGRMSQFFTTAQERYGIRAESVDFLNLTDGDKISYSFKSPEDADRFWAHAFDVLSDTMSTHDPIYLYNPHEWFILARHESELHLFTKLKDQKRQLWLSVGHRDPLDVYTKRFFDGTYLQYHMLEQPLFEKGNYYINIFDDYIIEATIDPETSQAVDDFYSQTTTYTGTVIPTLQTLVAKGKTKLTISRNAKKAARFKKLLGRFFFKTHK